MSALPTINDTVSTWVSEGAPPEVLVDRLVERENIMADMFRMAGMQFGLYPQIVAEVFAEVGIGTPIDNTQREMIRQQFTALMEELQRQHGAGGV